jgi:hypothetical protein
MYNGIKTDWDYIRNSVKWAEKLCNRFSGSSELPKYIQRICEDKNYANQFNRCHELLSKGIDTIDSLLNWVASLFDNKKILFEMSMPQLSDKIEQCKGGLNLLEEWIDYRTAQKGCANCGLEDYLQKIETTEIDKNNIIPSFRKRFYRLWLDTVLPEYPAAIEFRRKSHERIIAEFSELDKQQFEIAKSRIIQQLINNLPVLDRFSNAEDELGILRRELNKQRRIMPLRLLFKKIPNILLSLKPCFMMSPLTVSLFLESKNYIFDTVIFDEASQVCTENAMRCSCLLR